MQPSLAAQFERDGFVTLEGIFPLADIEALEAATERLARILLTQAGAMDLPKMPLELFRFAEKHYPDVFFQLCQAMGGTMAGWSLVTNRAALSVIKEIDGDRDTIYFPRFPAMFWNDREVKRLQYDWHQEASYFGDITWTLSLWFPLFRNITKQDGPMLIAKGSHAARMKYEVEKRDRSLLQLRIQEDVEQKFPIHECAINRGDAILFHDMAAHWTGENSSGLPRVSGIVRYVDATSAEHFSPMMSFTYKESARLAEKIDLGGTKRP